MFENPINKLRFWCHKVIPLVYDEALSYYEVLCKVAKKINEVITDVNGLHETVVFKVNGKEPTDGNVQLEASDFSGAFVGDVNGITPDGNGSVTINAEDVGAMPANERVVKTVNGISPNADGSILAGTVRSVNGKSPSTLPTPGGVTLNASDVGALPNSIDPVESVNGIAPDAQGNVNVGTVKSVNGSTPDSQGNVNLPTVAGVTSVNGTGPDSEGNVDVGTVRTINNISPTNANVILTPESIGFASSNYYVDGTNGSDSNDGTTEQTPFKTVSKAISTIQNSVYGPLKIIVHIKSGIYNERVRAYFWNSSTIQLNAEDGEVEIAEINLSGSKQIHFTSNANNTYGFTFKKNTATTSTELAAFAFTELYTECPIKIDPQSDSNMIPLNITQGSKFVIGYRGQLTFVNVTSTNAFRIHCSEMFSTWGSISSTVTTYDATHSIVCGVSNMTTSGTALTI